MYSDFQWIQQIMMQTKNPKYFKSLENLILAFENKWKPIYINKLTGNEVEMPNQKYKNFVQYLKLKYTFEYKKEF